MHVLCSAEELPRDGINFLHFGKRDKRTRWKPLFKEAFRNHFERPAVIYHYFGAVISVVWIFLVLLGIRYWSVKKGVTRPFLLTKRYFMFEVSLNYSLRIISNKNSI